MDTRLEPLGFTAARWSEASWDEVRTRAVTQFPMACRSFGSRGVSCVARDPFPDGRLLAPLPNDQVNKADGEGKIFGTMQCKDRWGRPVLLFRNEWKVNQVRKAHPL